MKAVGILLIAVWVLPLASSGRKLVQLENIRYYSYPEYTRVVLDLSAAVTISEKTLKSDSFDRLFFDITPGSFSDSFPANKKREITLEAGNLKKIRLGHPHSGAIRVVFDFDRIGRYQRFYLTSPFRVVFDINRNGEPAADWPEKNISPPIDPGGKPSLARQLGLKVRRIVIDPGHGGRDPGTINRQFNLQEKDLVLDIAKRLNAILNEHPEFEIILTRSRDETITLEERTAIANSNKGDVFVSIHLNSSPKRKVRGIETFFLSMTTDPWAIEVAAQENAMSSKSIGDLREILEQIIKNANVSESKILSSILQANIVKNLQAKYRNITDMGVKKAPFYVLAGAQMPSSLIEASFLSYPEEARQLATTSYRHNIAAGLYFGILSFIRSLNGS